MKTYVVFGGSRGIGANLVSILLKDGHAVLNVSRNDSEENHVNLSHHSLDVLEQNWDSLHSLCKRYMVWPIVLVVLT